MKTINQTTTELRHKYLVEVLLSLGILRDRLPKLGYGNELQQLVKKIDMFIRLNTGSEDSAALSTAGTVLKKNL